MESLPREFEWTAKTYLPLITHQPSLGVVQELSTLLQVCGWRGWVHDRIQDGRLKQGIH
jgi:hypothetical protein